MHIDDIMHVILSGACLRDCDACVWYCSGYMILLRDWGLSICTDFRSDLNENYDDVSNSNEWQTTKPTAKSSTATIKYVEKNATQSNDHGFVIPQNANSSISLYWWEFTRWVHIYFSDDGVRAHALSLCRFWNWITPRVAFHSGFGNQLIWSYWSLVLNCICWKFRRTKSS